jgi:hypothetical protein
LVLEANGSLYYNIHTFQINRGAFSTKDKTNRGAFSIKDKTVAGQPQSGQSLGDVDLRSDLNRYCNYLYEVCLFLVILVGMMSLA